MVLVLVFSLITGQLALIGGMNVKIKYFTIDTDTRRIPSCILHPGELIFHNTKLSPSALRETLSNARKS